jgi:hypothetical protein
MDSIDIKAALAKLDFTRALSLEQLKYLFSPFVWKFFTVYFQSPKTYVWGIECGLKILETIDKYKDQLSNEEKNTYYVDTYSLILKMYDKLDMWEEYLSAWTEVRANTSHYLKYVKRVLDGPQKDKILPFVLREGKSVIFVHFLYQGSHRKDLIERKLAKSKRGERMGNMLHKCEPQCSAEEMKRRLTNFRQTLRNYYRVT